MSKGRVIWFNKKRGYGFISPEDKTKDIFVHYSGILGEDKFKTLEQNQIVEYVVSDSGNGKGRTAINVQLIKDKKNIPAKHVQPAVESMATVSQ